MSMPLAHHHVTSPRSWLTVLGRGLLILLFLHQLLVPATASANGGPVRVVLTYLDGVSNWGSREASGVLEFVRSEGDVRLSASGLAPTPGQRYILWIAREGTDEVFRLGEIQAQADGTATLDIVIPEPIPDSGWNLALVTVEDSATPDRPGQQRAIAGRFPQPDSQEMLPRGLPNTGLGGTPMAAVPVALVVLIGAATAFVARRRS